MTASQSINLIVVVSGQPASVKVNVHQKVEHLVQEALKQSGNKGQAPGDWELRRSDGGFIDQSATVEGAGIADGTTLYLSPKAGAGGAQTCRKFW